MLGVHQRREPAAHRDNDFVAEFTPDRRGRFAALPPPAIEIHDFVGLLLEKYEGLDRTAAPQVASILNEMRRDAMAFALVPGADGLAAPELERAGGLYKNISACWAARRPPLRGRWHGRPSAPS